MNLEVKISSNARFSQARQRCKDKKTFIYKRGTNKYYLFLQKRAIDYYCLIIKSVGYPNISLLENFTYEDLVKSDKNINNIKIYLKELNNKITFSNNSEIIYL